MLLYAVEGNPQRNHEAIVGQRDAPDFFVAVEMEFVLIKIKGTRVYAAVVVVSLR